MKTLNRLLRLLPAAALLLAASATAPAQPVAAPAQSAAAADRTHELVPEDYFSIVGKEYRRRRWERPECVGFRAACVWARAGVARDCAGTAWDAKATASGLEQLDVARETAPLRAF